MGLLLRLVLDGSGSLIEWASWRCAARSPVHANEKLREALDRLASDVERRVLALRQADR